ncbi:MAG: PrgI family protein [Patescibacteria group bacterium]
MRYEVPQFIEIEDKIVGPLTWRQFVYVAGGVGGSVLAWFFLPTILAVPIVVVLLALGGALAFYEHNKQPFIVLLEAFISYTMRSKLYIWQKRAPQASTEDQNIESQAEAIINPQPYVPKLSDSKLKDLSWALDIEARNRGEVL